MNVLHDKERPPQGTKERLVVVGTGTDVGKTHVVASLLAFLRSSQHRVVPYKPVASGCPVEGPCPDVSAYAEVFDGPLPKPAYAFEPPVSPHLAAERAGVVLEWGPILEGLAAVEREASGVIVETAGGLFSPLGPKLRNGDLVAALAPCRVVLVAPDRIGVLHDVSATLEAARGRAWPVDAVVLSAPEREDPSTGTNAREIEKLGMASNVCVFPRAAPKQAPSLEVARQLLTRLGLWV